MSWTADKIFVKVGAWLWHDTLVFSVYRQHKLVFYYIYSDIEDN